ncbi:MAG: phosphomannomutase, partial [Selenomonadaceae bacterium]|nr:phosphomannomutase [Selenomonadaceae bacterium]
MNITTEAFGAFDVRGIYPENINEEIAYRIGRALPGLFDMKNVVVGYDIRLSSKSLTDALVKGLTESGADVSSAGLIGTEMIYFATSFYGFDGGVMVTA